MIQIRAGMPSASYQQHLKDQNATLLFDLVRRRAPISRAELTKASGLSAGPQVGEAVPDQIFSDRVGWSMSCCRAAGWWNWAQLEVPRVAGDRSTLRSMLRGARSQRLKFSLTARF